MSSQEQSPPASGEQAADSSPRRARSPPARCDVAIVGGGILGLAVARELRARRPATVGVRAGARAGARDPPDRPQLGRDPRRHLLHAGLAEGAPVRAGARELYAYCASGRSRTGALRQGDRRHRAPSELGRLDELERRGQANEVPGLRRLDAEGIRELEPHAVGIAGLHSPATGIVSFPAVARAYARTSRGRGGDGGTAARCTAVQRGRAHDSLEHTPRVHRGDHAIFCAGAWADRLAVAAGADPDPRIVPFRGAYLRLAAGAGRSGALADLSGARPGAAVPRRAFDEAHRR